MKKERLVWRFFQEDEKEVGMGLGISKDTLQTCIQQLIDEGKFVEPIVPFTSELAKKWLSGGQEKKLNIEISLQDFDEREPKRSRESAA